MSFDSVCDSLEEALGGSFRSLVIEQLSIARTLGGGLARLREAMRADVWSFGEARLTLALPIREYDRRTRSDGFHALHDWDGVAAHVNPETITVDVLDYVAGQRGGDPFDPIAPAILIDYYFMHVLSLLALRVWDEGDADTNLDRVGALLQLLQGPRGSGQRFCDDGETLLLIATAHYEREEWGYERLLSRTRTLDRRHQTGIALGHAAALGCHLRFGFEATYARDTSLMRKDNVADYPWLCFSLATVMDAYASTGDAGRIRLVESMLNGLAADPRAFLGPGTPSLAAHEVERTRFRDQFEGRRTELTEAFAACQPSEGAYSPLSLFFNFSHNVVKGQVVDSLLWSLPWTVGLSDLLASAPPHAAPDRAPEPPERSRETLARTLTAYARTNPHKIRGRLMPVIVYDPDAGYRAFRLTLRRLSE